MTREQPDTAPIGPGMMVDHFRVVRLLGRGGMGEVYLARDTKLGRKVALKVVHTRSLGNAEAVERFLFEARTTARFSHPNIVTVFAVGEHGGSPYVALEYLEGQNLRMRMEERRMGLKEILRVGVAVGEALAEAHSHGVLHRDLKPANVLVPRDGRVRVVDFGLAKAFGEEAFVSQPGRLGGSPPSHPISVKVAADAEEIALAETEDLESLDEVTTLKVAPLDSAIHEAATMDVSPQSTQGRLMGTPLYMAPEQWARGQLTTAVDVWAFGLMLVELVLDKHPFADMRVRDVRERVPSPEPMAELEVLQRLPPGIGAVVHRCLDKDPTARPEATEVTQRLRELLNEAPRNADGEGSPFRGLLPFTERQAHLFFGRDDEVAQFLERLRQEPVLAVVGPSGAGKSSFVRAGVIPRLMEQERWTVLSVRPGRQPFEALASLLLRPDTAGAASHPTMRSVPPPGAPEAPRDPAAETRLCDELVESPARLALHLHLLAEQHQAPLLLFVDQLEELATHVEDESVRRRFIEAVSRAADDPHGPVRVIVTLRDDFMGRLAEGQAARDALSRVAVLRSPGKEALGQILSEPARAAGYRYDDPELVAEIVAAVEGEPAALPLVQFVGQLLWEQRDTDEHLLLRSAYDAAGGVEGALAQQADLMLEGLTSEQLALARELFLRLVSADGTRRVVARADLLDGLAADANELLDRLVGERALLVRKGPSGPEVEIVHESLVRRWQWLQACIAESREELVFLGEVEQAATLWEKRGGRGDELWQDDALHEALRNAERCSTQLPAASWAFLEAGRRRETQRLWRRRLLLAAVMVGLVAVAIVFAVQNRQLVAQGAELVNQRREAEDKRTEALLEGARAALTQGHVLEARAKLRAALEQGDAPLGRALWWRLRRNPLLWSKEFGSLPYGVSFSPDGRAVAVANQDGSVYLIDVETRQLRVLRGHTDQVIAVAFAPVGERLASAGASGVIHLWDAQTGRELRKLTGHTAEVWVLSFAPGGKLLASGGGDKTVRVWNLESGAEPRVLAGHDGPVYAMGFSRNGELLASGGVDKSVRVWNVASATLRHKLEEVRPVYGVSFGAGQLLASATGDAVQLWDAAAGRRVRTLTGHAARVYGVSFGPKGKRLASGSLDGTVRLWDGESGAELRRLHRGTAGALSLSISPQGHRLAVGSYDNTVRLWSLATDGEERPPSGHADAVHDARFSGDASRVVSASADRSVRVWDVASGEQLAQLLGHDGAVMGVDIGPDGKRLVSGGHDNTIRIWNVATATEERKLSAHEEDVQVVRFDGLRLASASHDKTVRLWNVETGKETQRFATKPGPTTVALSPGSQAIAVGDHSRVRVWTSPDQEARVLEGHTNIVDDLSFNADGTRIAAASWDRSVMLWDAVSGEQLRRFEFQESRALGVAFAPDDQHIAAALTDGTVRLLAVEGDSSLELRGHRSEVNAVAFDPSGQQLVTASDDGTIRVWDAKTGRPIWRGPLLLAQPDGKPLFLSHRGWSRLAGDGKATGTERAEREWQRALEAKGALAAYSPEGDRLCLTTHDGDLATWQLAADKRRYSWKSEGILELVATAEGCLARQQEKDGDGRALFFSHGGVTPLSVEGKVTALARDRTGMLVAAGSEVFGFDASGAARGRHPAGVNVTAVSALDDDWLIVGYRDGNIELLPSDTTRPKPTHSFEGVPSSPVMRILAGPMRTLIVGYANGVVGLWNRDDGKQLERTRVHGPVTHLLVQDERLYAATDLGQHMSWDLSLFSADRCALLRELWQRVPVVWEGGQPVAREPPAGHGCNR